MSYTETLADRLVRARLELGARLSPIRCVTQTEVAKAMGVTHQTVSNWEAGKTKPDLETIPKLAMVVEVRAGWLAWGERPMHYGGPNNSEDPVPVARPDRRRA